jgi:ABC-type multidrug transport system ATPase subunit
VPLLDLPTAERARAPGGYTGPVTSRFLLEARGVSLAFGSVQVLTDVSLGVHPGELVLLLGPSGSGKSSLLKVLAGITAPDQGEVLLRGEDVSGLDRALVARTIGMVPQDDIIHTELALRPALEYAARLRLPAGTSEEAITAAVDRVLAATELAGRADVKIGRLSGGQRKRASMGVELLAAPPVLLLDEPTSGLDPDLEATTTALLRRLADEGRAVLTTTHAMASIDLAHAVVIIVAGQLAFAGTPAQAIEHFQVPDPDLIFKRLREDKPAGWAARYRRSPFHERFRARPAPAPGPVAGGAA